MSDRQRRAPDGAADDRGSEAWLSGLLEAAAAAYEPDAERLRALVAARTGETPGGGGARDAGHAARRGARRRDHGARRLRPLGRLGLAGVPAGAALAVIGATAALAVGATATIAVTSGHDGPTTIKVLTTSAGISGAAPAPSQSSATPRTSSARTSGPPASTHAPASATGPSSAASASGSGGTNALFTAGATVDPATNPNWTQLDVRVTAKQPLTALTITIKVPACAGLVYTSQFSSAPGSDFTESGTTNGDGSITYTFALRPGVTFAPSAQGPVFAAQFNHAATGWNPALDGYTVDARTLSSAADTVVRGTF